MLILKKWLYKIIGYGDIHEFLVIKQKFLEFIDKGSIYKNYFDSDKVIFVHIPKTAGTSISYAIYGGISWPWHFNAQQCRSINTNKYNEYFKFAFVRDPVDRLISTYNYAQTHVHENRGSSIEFLLNYSSFDEFVLNWLNSENVKNHYFFRTQRSYIYDDDGVKLVDSVYKMEFMSEALNDLEGKLGKKLNVENKNKSKASEVCTLNKEIESIIKEVYKEDYIEFGY